MRTSTNASFHLLNGEDDHKVRSVVLSEEPTIIGRSSQDPAKAMESTDSNLHIQNPVISRHHAKVTYQPDKSKQNRSMENQLWAVHVEDLNSSHGTYVNGVKLAPGIPKPAYPGAEIILGVPIARSDKSTLLPPTYRLEYDEETIDSVKPTNHIGRSYAMPNEQDVLDDLNEYHDEDEDEIPQGYLFWRHGEDRLDEHNSEIDYIGDDCNSECDSELDGPSAKSRSSIPFNSQQETEIELGGEGGDLDNTSVEVETQEPPSAQSLGSPKLPDTMSTGHQSLPTPEEETSNDKHMLLSSSRKTFWDAIRDIPATIEATPISQFDAPQARPSLNGLAGSMVSHKRKFEGDDDDDHDIAVKAQNEVFVVDSWQTPRVSDTMQATQGIATNLGESNGSSDRDHDTTLVGGQAEDFARLLKEPTEMSNTAVCSGSHRQKRSRLGDVAFGVGMLLAGSISTLAGLAALPEGYFAS